ncbi:MAG TPA: histidine kinase, partial [Ferruginibacter sp.]|nr:histidine kinase [Ferruginibacter sp.]
IISMVCSAILVAKHTGWLNLPVSSGTFMGMGSIIEMIVMTAGITLQFYSYKKEKEELLISYLEQQKAINQQILMTEEAERKRIARELHDDIGAGLTRITLMSDAVKNKINVSAKEIEEIAQTCRRLVGNMGEIVWSLSPENNSLEALIAYLREELHKLLEYSGIEYSIHLPESGNGMLLSNEQRRNILLVTKEVVHNAVKYSNAANISIHSKILLNNITVFVKDDGNGFDETIVRNGNGLRNIRQRIQELGGTISINSEAGRGTIVEFNVKIN